MELPILLTAVTIVLLLILSVPIAAALGLGVMVGMIAGDLPPEFMMQKVFSSLDSFPLLAVPFFILAGEIMQKAAWPTRCCASPAAWWGTSPAAWPT